ncbi:MAG TPA: CoA-binding protein [Candidatus Dormibacteraeota bacterium]|nr:CoA-binding protein [Candidatus Dormibacteraeota bacterium]
MIARGSEAVLVQGITGDQGSFWTARMMACGTRIVAGSSPGKRGRSVHGVPVYDSAVDACAHAVIDAAVLFTPPLATKRAALDALEAGIGKIVVLTEHVPVHDVMEVLAEAAARGARVVGPNTAGLVTPGEASLGFMPAFDERIFRPGSVGVVARSGSLGTLTCLNVVRAGLGESAFIGVGGDPILGTTILDALRALENDPRTKAAVVIGEVGGVMEEAACEFIAAMAKPVVAFVAGRTAPPGRRMGHAGAIAEGDRGSAESKVRALRGAGARVLNTPTEVGDALHQVLRG